MVLLLSIVSGCDDRLDWIKEPEKSPEISGLFPDSGAPGITVVIAGSSFSKMAVNNSVSFNGVPADIVSASGTELAVIVPASTTGPVTVTVREKTAKQQPVFTYE